MSTTTDTYKKISWWVLAVLVLQLVGIPSLALDAYCDSGMEMPMEDHACCSNDMDHHMPDTMQPSSDVNFCTTDDACACAYQKSDKAILIKDPFRAPIVFVDLDITSLVSLSEQPNPKQAVSGSYTKAKAPPLFLLNSSFLN